MITYPNTLYSEDELLQLLREFHGDGVKWGKPSGFRRRSVWGGNKYSSTNPRYYIAFEGEVPVGYGGFEDNGKFIVSAGVAVHSKYRKQGISEKLVKKRNDKYDAVNKPVLVGMDNKIMPSETWKASWARTGWLDSPEDSELNEETLEAIPKEVLDYHRQKYVDVWMLYPVGPKPMAKAWRILKWN